jgi:hypothetical protein
MKLVGIELMNFRSIGLSPVVLHPIERCNILIGQNNAGKSNVIRAVRKLFAALIRMQSSRPQGDEDPEQVLTLSAYDIHKGSINPFTFTLKFRADEQDAVEADLVRIAGTQDFDFTFTWNLGTKPHITDLSIARILDFGITNMLLKLLTGNYYGSPVPHEVMRTKFLEEAPKVFGRYVYLPKVEVIPEFRQIRSGDEYTLSGTNLIGLLASYQHPTFENSADRAKFDRIEQFARRLLHMPDAQLEVTHDNATIMLSNDGYRLPLASYGTGVHQLVIMVTAVLSLDNALCCIEEPEIHLHPTLQRQFIDFIIRETTNSYLLSTHSPTFINAHTKIPSDSRQHIQIFHLRREHGATVGQAVLEEASSLYALNDLGVTASDLLQTNCVIWVEGPSDRVYLNHWIQLVDPLLVEGLHYAIMFYGGKLLSHLTVDRDRIADELINLLKINQNAIVLIDSDRKNKYAATNQTKKRICAECERSGGLCWITDGREIENYIPARVVHTTCSAVGPSIKFEASPFEKFEGSLDAALEKVHRRPWRYAEDKVKYARLFTQHFEAADFSVELRNRLEAIVEKITVWNS